MDNRGFDQDQFNGGAKAARLHRQSASETVGKKSLGDLAYSEIKRRIINLDFRPGDYLNEASICAKLGMTRSPVHQAMQRLMHEGLVRVIPRKGVFVQPVTFDEVADVIDVRFLNEPYCVERATEAATTGRAPGNDAHPWRAASMIVARDIEGLMNWTALSIGQLRGRPETWFWPTCCPPFTTALFGSGSFPFPIRTTCGRCKRSTYGSLMPWSDATGPRRKPKCKATSNRSAARFPRGCSKPRVSRARLRHGNGPRPVIRVEKSRYQRVTFIRRS